MEDTCNNTNPTMEWVLHHRFPSLSRAHGLADGAFGPPSTGEFKLSGLLHDSSSLAYLYDHISDFYGFFCVMSRRHIDHFEPGLDMADIWSEHVVPTPALNECTQDLITEEALLISNIEWVQTEAESSRQWVLRQIDSDDNDIPVDDDVLEYNLDKRCCEFPDGYYARCVSELRCHTILEKAVFSGHLVQADLRWDFGSDMDSYCAHVMNKLVIYQLIKRTSMRINQRCAVYRETQTLPCELSTLVCVYLGESAGELWHGASFNDMWVARVQAYWTDAVDATAVGGIEGENGGFKFTLPLPPLHGTLNLIFTKKGEDFWKMPW